MHRVRCRNMTHYYSVKLQSLRYQLLVFKGTFTRILFRKMQDQIGFRVGKIRSVRILMRRICFVFSFFLPLVFGPSLLYDSLHYLLSHTIFFKCFPPISSLNIANKHEEKKCPDLFVGHLTIFVEGQR